MRQNGLALLASISLLVLAACGEGSASADSAANRSDADFAAPTGIDWESVDTLGDQEAMMPYTHIARLADVWHGGARARIRLRFDEGHVIDDEGNRAAMAPEAWKSIVAVVRRSPDGASATQAMPGEGGHIDYGDGLGDAPRYGYFVEEGEPYEIILTLDERKRGHSAG